MTEEGGKSHTFGDDNDHGRSGPGTGPDAMSSSLGDQDRLPENCVEYWLFVIGSGSQLDARQTRQRLETIRKAAAQLCQSLTKDYIWQRDEFHVELENANGLLHLHGVTDYGDAVEDEWLIVYMLRELTKLHPDLWIRVVDSDGEFLLIEAANALPRWLSPDIDHSRVWIHDAKLLLIPPDNTGKNASSTSTSKASILSLPQAVDFLKSSANALIHSTAIEAEAFYRLDKYPNHIASSMHHASVTIPRKLAYVLHSLSRTIAPAIECFYLRDPFALKPVLSASGPWIFPPKDLVTVSVRFSKVLFAQLRSQRLEAPPSWHAALQAMSSSSDAKTRERDILETGMKLTAGFEMLAPRAEENKVRVVREMAILLEDLEEDGEETLPSNQEIESWEMVHRNDDESWLDINYNDFERELEGKGERDQGQQQHHPNQQQTRSGFGDSQTQENLRKIVSRFEDFLKDDEAGLDGAELDSEESDDDQEDDEEGSDVEDREVDFDQDAFAKLMQEMMGQRVATSQSRTSTLDKGKQRQTDNSNSSNDGHDDEERAIQDLSSQMEAELKEFGALRIDDRPTQKKAAIESHANTRRKVQDQDQDQDNEDQEQDSGDEIDIDYNLAKNLLESFKSQGGMAGPAGNLMGLMGFQLPRDEDEDEKED